MEIVTEENYSKPSLGQINIAEPKEAYSSKVEIKGSIGLKSV
jgi:hypothetical protein